MSEDEHIRGKLIPTGKTVEEYLEGVTLNSWNESLEEYFEDEEYRTACIINGKVFEIQSKDVDIYDDIFESSLNEDGSYDFEIKYYNGDCGFNEAIEEALDNCKGKA